MNRWHLKNRNVFLWIVGACMLAVPFAWARDEDASLTRAERRALWGKNMEAVERLRETPVPEQVNDVAEPQTTEQKVRHWLAVYRTQLAEHTAAKQKDYDRYVERAKGHLEKKEIREALIETQRAMLNASDEEALRSSDWVRELEGLAVEKAQAYRRDKEWNKAHAIYYELTELFEHNKEYEKGRRECLNIARLDAIYEDERRWKELLEGIDPANAADALSRIERYYVEDTDMTAVAAAGIEHLLLLGESESLRKAFPGLADDDLRGDFNARLRARLERAKAGSADAFHAKHAVQYFRRILQINEETVQLPDELIVYEFMAGALEPLDDFTSVIWPVEFREFDKHTRGGFVGVGISITGGDENPVTVVTPLEDTPAYRAGVLPDDVITHVDGKSIEGLSLNKVVQIITGPIDTEVTLTVHRPSLKKDIDFTLRRAQVEIQSVKGYVRDPDDPEKWDYMIDADDGIGYARVLQFQENTVEQLSAAIQEMKDKGAKGLILDLRFNPGGLMKAAIEMAQLFLNRTDTVVSTRGLREADWQNPAPASDGPYRDLPLVVLVNEYSASASEIVSGALQDHKRALIVGERTFGKFSVQKLMQLSGGYAHLKLTTARYYLPSGREMHHEEGRDEWGVMPDFEHRVVPKEIYKIREMWRDRDVLGRAPQADASADESAAAESGNRADTEKTVDGESAGTATDSAAPDDAEATKGDGDATDTAGEKKDDDGKGENKDDEEGEEDDPDALNLAPDPNELPDIDLQLETALLLMRLHLVGQAELEVAAAQQPHDTAQSVRNP